MGMTFLLRALFGRWGDTSWSWTKGLQVIAGQSDVPVEVECSADETLEALGMLGTLGTLGCEGCLSVRPSQG